MGANYERSTKGTDDNPNTGTGQRGGSNEDHEDSAGELEQPIWGGAVARNTNIASRK